MKKIPIEREYIRIRTTFLHDISSVNIYTIAMQKYENKVFVF